MILLSLLVLCLALISVSAEGLSSNGKTGILTVHMLLPDSRPAQGAELELYYVGQADKAGGSFTFLPNGIFKNSGVTFYNMTDSKAKTIAVNLTRFINKNSLAGIRQSTGSDGAAVFSGLKLGVYLIVVKALPSGWQSSPFLVSVPVMNSEGTDYMYSIDAYPKIGTSPETTTGSDPGKDPHLPQTGIMRWPVFALSTAGILLFSAGWSDIYIRRRKFEK